MDIGLLEGNKEGKKKLDLFHFDWICVDFLWIIMFLSAIRTLILMATIRCRGSIGEQVM